MTRLEHLLTTMAEECNETAQRLSKALRFGLDDCPPGSSTPNRQLINIELTHILAVAEMLDEEFSIGFRMDPEVAAAKRAAVNKWLAHSANQGTLTA